jgi:hypothetical protein
MEKMYKAIQQKITTIEPNQFDSKKNTLHKEYMNQLDKTIKTYPDYKAEITDDYVKQLSLLNGITKKIKNLQTEINDKVTLFQRKVALGDTDIQKLKKVETNLKTYTSFEMLDATSKQMLSDSIVMYNRQRVLFWIKIGFILLILLYSVQHNESKKIVIVCMGTFALSLISLVYLAYTSHG